MPRRLTVTIGADPPPRLDRALARDVPAEEELSRSRLARLIGAGAVRRAGVALTEPTARVAEGDLLEIEIDDPAPAREMPQAIPLAIAYEDDELIVVDKPAGMVVHPAPGNAEGTLVNALLHHCGPGLAGVGGQGRPGIVHRLDKDTSGLLVAAKTDRAHHALARQFAAHTVTRRYLAAVHGAPDPADARLRGLPGITWESASLRIATQIGRHRTDRQRQAVLASGGRHAVTRVTVVERFGTPPVASMVECRLETGRTHQIRVHLAYAGHGIIGDPVYGGRRRLSGRIGVAGVEAAAAFPRQALHAAALGFDHPATGERMEFRSPLPGDMEALCAALRV